MKNKNLTYLVLSAMFLAIGIVLPFFTGNIKEIGNMLLPMHLPVLLCGLICGWQYGLCVGLIVPLLRSMIVGMPMLFPTAIAMSFELACYGMVISLVYNLLKRKTYALYISLIVAMLSGRIVWGIVSLFLYGIKGSAFTWQIFFAGAFTKAIPGIVLQIVLVPVIIILLKKFRLIKE